MEMPAVNGIGTARSVAKLFSLVMSGRIISKQLLKRLLKPVDMKIYDEVFGFKVISGYGFLYTINPMGQLLLNHAGFGGQDLKVDIFNNLSFAYLTNKVKLDIGERSPIFRRLQTAVYECFHQEKKKL
ncbi:unnamed protein product [Soboliphyme baturini]|uniref:Beta-lactamase domain-containing protein n=1 Tax=Soboliphyme baturini TaxID=241478 RepID=A0A183J3X4_9BILA|nr:unnamed protein product [Soboliphyme baturini]